MTKRYKKALKKQENLQPFLSARHNLKSAFFKLSHLAPCSFCQASAEIFEQSKNVNSSSSIDWLKAWSKPAAPSAPFVCSLKHLQCFVRINLSKTLRDYDKCRYTIHLKPIQVNSNSYDNFTDLYKSELGQHPITETKRRWKKARKHSTISLCEAPREICLLQVEPLGTMQFLPRCCGDPRTEAKIQDFNGRRAHTCH